MKKYAKDEYVNVISPFNNKSLGVGKIIGWQYDPENKTYDYQVELTNTREIGWFEEGHIENLKINLDRVDEDRMNTFYLALNNAELDVQFNHNKTENTYILVGTDLKKAKKLYHEIVRNPENNPCPSK